MPECNVDEILKQMKILDNLKQIRENMDLEVLGTQYPELGEMGSRLDTIIAEQETKLEEKMSTCGQLDIELPDLEPASEADTGIPESEVYAEEV